MARSLVGSFSNGATQSSNPDSAESTIGNLLGSHHCKPHCKPHHRPTTMRDILRRLLDQSVVIVTPFDTVSGTLIAVKADSVVLLDTTLHLILIPIRKVKSVTPE